MNEKFLVLERIIQQDLETIEEIYGELSPAPIPADASQNELIVIAYRLHGLYCAMENLFSNIAHAFENHLDEASGWHRQLLSRMRLDLTPLRPAVIDGSTYDSLDELRRFRHLFRYAYNTQFDTRHLVVVLEKAWQMRESFFEQIRAFQEFLQGIE